MATDRAMTLLAVREGKGEVTGLVSWLGLYGTTVHADNTRIHPDHKGLAASAFEARGVSALFAQECCGDVSPNHRLDAHPGAHGGRQRLHALAR